MTDEQSPIRDEAARDPLLQGFRRLDEHDELGLDPAEVWARGQGRRTRRRVATGALAVAVVAGGAWGASRYVTGSGPVVAAGSTGPSAVAVPSGLRSSTASVTAESLAGTSWKVSKGWVDRTGPGGEESTDASRTTAAIAFTDTGASGNTGRAASTCQWHPITGQVAALGFSGCSGPVLTSEWGNDPKYVTSEAMSRVQQATGVTVSREGDEIRLTAPNAWVVLQPANASASPSASAR